MRRATFLCIFKHLPSDNFYPRSPCGERPILGNPCAGCPAISIHALLAESDSSSALDASAAAAFLSTLSLRRATGKPGRSGQVRNHFYPRSPCGERLINSIHNVLMYRISIHALLAESDVKHLRQVLIQLYFYPRSPCGERLCLAKPLYASWIISIHALLAESDRAHFVGIVGHIYFYPRSPCGERPLRTIGMSSHLHFYPRSPCGERLCFPISSAVSPLFLSTLSLRRATLSIFLMVSVSLYFYPRSPCGERPSRFVRIGCILLFLSTLSLRRATWSCS